MLKELKCFGDNVRKVATPGGFEPLTSWFEAKRSIQLSYGVVWVRIAEAGGKIKRAGWLRMRLQTTGIRKVATPGGFEPLTSWFVAKRSIQLSYGVV